MKTFTFEDIIEIDEYRERIVKYFRLPMDVKVSLPRFCQDLVFLDEIGEINANEIKAAVIHDFNACAKEQGTELPEFAMEDVIEEIIEDIQSKPSWSEFLEREIPALEDNYRVSKSVFDFYSKENDNKYFMSIDLRSANWQTIKAVTGITGDYGDYIRKFTDKLIPPLSKTFRVKINGKLAVKQVQTYNKYSLLKNMEKIIASVSEITDSTINLNIDNLTAIYADEIIFEVSYDDIVNFSKFNQATLEKEMLENTGLDTHLTVFKLIEVGTDKIYGKVDNRGHYELKMISKDMELLFKRVATDKFAETTFTPKLLKGATMEELIDSVSKSLKKLDQESCVILEGLK